MKESLTKKRSVMRIQAAKTNGLMPMSSSEVYSLATSRCSEMFQEDLLAKRLELEETIGGARILVVGGAGTIGSATIRELCGFKPAALDIVDLNENGLAELVRDLRSSGILDAATELLVLPLDVGSPIMTRFLLERPPYDLVLNFAALKHVRSEKHICSVLELLDTNLLKAARLMKGLGGGAGTCRYFAVSSDKAANPFSVMGASKRLMEELMFSGLVSAPCISHMTSARFANVAFSNGSLLEGIMQRLQKKQPIAVPADTRRYFVTPRESGCICLLASICLPDKHLAIPRLDAGGDLRLLEDVVADILRYVGYEPHMYSDEAEARSELARDMSRGCYPVVVTARDTSGEKPFEVFVADGEQVLDIGMSDLQAIAFPKRSTERLQRFLQSIERYVAQPGLAVTKADILRMMKEVVPEMHHVETGKNLDQRM